MSNKLQRCLMALRLEVPKSVADDVEKTITSEIKLLTDLLKRAKPELTHYPVLQDDISDALAKVGK